MRDDEDRGQGTPSADDDALDPAALDPAALAALIEAQQARVREGIDVDGRLLFGAWGVAWLVGFGVMWLQASGRVALPEPVPGATFGFLLVAAAVLTAVHTSARSTGLRGVSATQGAMFGWAWALGFGGVMTLGFSLVRQEADPEVISTVMTVASTTLVAALYMAGGALWGDRVQFSLGAWIGLTTIVAAVIGYPTMQLVMALAGGGGMLVAAVAEHARRRASRRRTGGPVPEDPS